MSRWKLAIAILVERYGWDGGRPRSVEAVARARRIPRATVRQLESEAIRELRKAAG